MASLIKIGAVELKMKKVDRQTDDGQRPTASDQGKKLTWASAQTQNLSKSNEFAK